MIRSWTAFPSIAHKSEEDAKKYYNDPAAYHDKWCDVQVMSCKLFKNSLGFWQTDAEIKYNELSDKPVSQQV